METLVFDELEFPFHSFKSYYVVWKPFRFLRIFRSQFPFKSYYVVWKPSVSDLDASHAFCLNRTMQYGNERLSEGERKILSGLNRTMQYGNLNNNINKTTMKKV